MEDYRGYEIEVVDNNEKEYPYKAIGRKENHEIKHKGHSKEEAIDHVKQVINLSLVHDNGITKNVENHEK